MLPKDFPAWQTVYWWFRQLVRRFLFQTIHDVVLMLDRELVGRQAQPECRRGRQPLSRATQAPPPRLRCWLPGKVWCMRCGFRWPVIGGYRGISGGTFVSAKSSTP